MITAKKIERIVNTKGIHVLYREDGKWYNNLVDFPGTLFDINGYIVFTRKADYENNEDLRHGKRLNISVGISQMRGYKKYTEVEKRQVLEMI